MAQRVIPCRVVDDYITGDGVTIGGAGSHEDVLLEMDFRADDTPWKGTTRTATFTNAMGLDPINVLLTANLLAEGQTEVYLVPVPVRCKAYPGWISVTVTGVEVSGGNEVVRIVTGDARFRVLDNVLHRWSGSEDVPASATEQLQAEIDEIKDLIRTQWVYLFVSDGSDGRENGVLYAQTYTGQPHDFVLTEDGYLEVEYE